jgi:methylated-DNA-[protein]-cysteine S-methyltransferase
VEKTPTKRGETIVLTGTEFQIKVWKELRKIPSGETRSYKEVAEAIGHPNSSRAVANACAKNPRPDVVPCHRVIRSDGGLGGYSGEGGVETKLRLLSDEEAF